MNIFIPKLVQRYQVPLLSEAFQNSPRWSTRMGTENCLGKTRIFGKDQHIRNKKCCKPRGSVSKSTVSEK